MADYNSVIEDLVVGDDYDIIRDITLIPTGQELVEAKMTVKENVWSTDFVFSKLITSTINGDGIIEDTGVGDTIGKIRFTITSDETLLLKANYVYVFDIQLKTNIGKIFTPEIGSIKARDNITS